MRVSGTCGWDVAAGFACELFHNSGQYRRGTQKESSKGIAFRHVFSILGGSSPAGVTVQRTLVLFAMLTAFAIRADAQKRGRPSSAFKRASRGCLGRQRCWIPPTRSVCRVSISGMHSWRQRVCNTPFSHGPTSSRSRRTSRPRTLLGADGHVHRSWLRGDYALTKRLYCRRRRRTQLQQRTCERNADRRPGRARLPLSADWRAQRPARGPYDVLWLGR